MSRFKIFWCIVLIVILPVSIVALSGNAVLRISETYVYHFNDSLVTEDVGSSITGSEFADAFSDYFNSFNKEEFQIFEENGEFRDPVFDVVESNVMAKCKSTLIWTLLIGIVLFGGSIAIYIYLVSTMENSILRYVGFFALGLSVFDILAIAIGLSRPGIRSFLYEKFIGIDLGKETTLRILLGTPFEKTYVIFSSVLSVVLIGVLLYIHFSLTREKRLFS